MSVPRQSQVCGFPVQDPYLVAIRRNTCIGTQRNGLTAPKKEVINGPTRLP
jgi:hypothetical protein